MQSILIVSVRFILCAGPRASNYAEVSSSRSSSPLSKLYIFYDGDCIYGNIGTPIGITDNGHRP